MYNQKHAEIANYWTHGFGLLFFGILSFFLVRRGWVKESSELNFSLLLFSASQILLYFSSTIYHVVTQENLKRKLRYLDHFSIYFSIAGSYSPILLWVVKGSLGWTFFFIIWGLALLGVIYKLFFLGKYPKLSLALYLSMGWIVVFFIKIIFDNFPSESLWFLLLEGISFTAGTYFFWKDLKHTYYHSIWHVFVYAGSLFHYLVLWFLV